MEFEREDNIIGKQIGDYLLTQLLSIGTYGAVYAGEHVRTEALYAIKCLTKGELTEEQQEIQRAEIEINKALGKHENICHMVESIETEEYLFLVFEFCESDDLFELVGREGLTGKQVLNLFSQILTGISYCHSRSVFHRDLKPENILLTHNSAKIADFGLATRSRFSTDFGIGSAPYMAPELFSHSNPSSVSHSTSNSRPTSTNLSTPLSTNCINSALTTSLKSLSNNSPSAYSSEKVDVWALGVILFNLLYKVNPWEVALMSDPLFQKHVQSPKEFGSSRMMSPQLSKIFDSVFEIDPEKRCSLQELQKMISQLSPSSLPLPIDALPTPVSALSKEEGVEPSSISPVNSFSKIPTSSPKAISSSTPSKFPSSFDSYMSFKAQMSSSWADDDEEMDYDSPIFSFGEEDNTSFETIHSSTDDDETTQEHIFQFEDDWNKPLSTKLVPQSLTSF